VELYLYPPYVLTWCVEGQLYFLYVMIFLDLFLCFLTITRFIVCHRRVEECERQSLWPNVGYCTGIHVDSPQNSRCLGRDSNGVPLYYFLRLTYVSFTYVSSHTAEIHAILVGCNASVIRAFCLFVCRVCSIRAFCIPHRHMKFAHHTFTVYHERRQDVTVLGW
jgi:hypothetical protein